MRVRKMIILCLVMPLILLGQCTVTLVILRHLGGAEWMSPNLFYFLLIYPVAHGVFHWIQDNTKAISEPEQKVLFGKIRMSKRLYATLVACLIVLVCCVAAALITRAELRRMMVPVIIAVVFFVNEEIGYQGLRFANWMIGRLKNT